MQDITELENTLQALHAMQVGTISLLEGCRLLARLLPRLDPSVSTHSAALTIFGVESETDAFPSDAQRQHWDEAALQRLDKEMADYFATVRESLLEACRLLSEHIENAISCGRS
jgi:hypothetical protein